MACPQKSTLASYPCVREPIASTEVEFNQGSFQGFIRTGCQQPADLF